MKLIFLGVQGSGKGTQAKIISELLKINHISTGDLLRNLDGGLKKEAESYMNSGKLVPDSFIIQILKLEIQSSKSKNGFILDGFPRNINQALELDKITSIDEVIEIEISDDEAVSRIADRISCKNCGSVYNNKSNPPKQNGICDKCGYKLERRKDDNREAIKKRIETYHKETIPILKHYKSIKINGMQQIEKVTSDILKKI